MATFYEFFAGGGMARAGLGDEWTCLYANDFDFKKTASYINNWGEKEIATRDVREVRAADLPGHAQLVWGSFPCQDLSLAGAGAGLRGDRSGTFWPFWKVITELVDQGRAPAIITLENVIGTLHSHDGKDFTEIIRTMADAGYRTGALVIDAALFVPQSRPRLFIVGVRSSVDIPSELVANGPAEPWHPKQLRSAFAKLPEDLSDSWVWWNLPIPDARQSTFSDLIEEQPTGTKWHEPAETAKLIGMMSSLNLAKLEDAKTRSTATGKRAVGAIYKRTRRDEAGNKVQRAEVRFDDVAGCLRTPSGGSSRQLIIVIDGHKVRTRLISSRETARLMGLPDSYRLPDNYNEAYHLTGDGLAVPAVSHLARSIFDPLLDSIVVREDAA